MIELQRTADGMIHQAFGGDTFNSAAYFSRLGKSFNFQADYVSALGDDNFSASMRRFWEAEGVGTSLTRTMPGRRPGLYFIEVDASGERYFTYWRGEAAARDTFEEGSGDAVLEGLKDFDAVYLSGISLAVLRGNGRERLVSRLEKLSQSGTSIFFDCNFRPLLWAGEKSPAENARLWYERVFAIAETVFVSRDEINALGFEKDAATEKVCAAVLARGAREAVLKDGGGVCCIANAEGSHQVPARKLSNVVDTTAAGDSFSAAYIVCRKLGLSPAAAAEKAHELSAAVVSHKGAIIPRDAMPELFRDADLS